MKRVRNPLGGSAFMLCLLAVLSEAWGVEYLSNLGNLWSDPGTSMGDIVAIYSGVAPFTLQFFTGAPSGETTTAGIITGQAVIGAHPTNVVAFELNLVTLEFVGDHTQPWSDVSVQVYQQMSNGKMLVGELGNPVLDPSPTQWPESRNPPWFCTCYVDYTPLTEISLQPTSEYSLVLNGSNCGLLFSLSSQFVTATDWRMGTTTTSDPWVGSKEFLKVAIAATEILEPSPPNAANANFVLSAKVAGTDFVLSWPASIGRCNLYASPSLQPGAWTQVQRQPIITNGQYLITLPLSSPSCYFRLQTQ